MRLLLKILFYLAIIVICFKLIIAFGMPQFRYHAYKSDVKEILKLNIGEDEDLVGKLYEEAQGYKLPIEKRHIVLIRDDANLRATVSWSETVDLYGFYSKKFDFVIDEER